MQGRASTRAPRAEVTQGNTLVTTTHDLAENLAAIVRHVVRHADCEAAAAAALGLGPSELRPRMKALGVKGGWR